MTLLEIIDYRQHFALLLKYICKAQQVDAGLFFRFVLSSGAKMKKSIYVVLTGLLLSALASLSFAFTYNEPTAGRAARTKPPVNFSQPAQIVKPFHLGQEDAEPIILTDSTGSCGGSLRTSDGRTCGPCSSKSKPVMDSDGTSCRCEPRHECGG